MKRKIMGLAVIALALSLSAFHAKPATKQLPSYFWFPLNAVGQYGCVSRLFYQSYDPAGCLNWAWGDYCEAAYTGFAGSYPAYYPAGLCVVVDYESAPF